MFYINKWKVSYFTTLHITKFKQTSSITTMVHKYLNKYQTEYKKNKKDNNLMINI